MNSFVHYTDIEKSRLDINCNNCGHKFQYGETTPRFCPSCGARFGEEKFNNIPMSIVPNGMKAFLYKNYEKYKDEYYHNRDNWNEITIYLKIIYNPSKIDFFLKEDMGAIANVVKGYALKNKREVCFISDDKNFIGFYVGKEKNKKNIKIYSLEEFKEELLKITIKEKK